MSTDSVDVTNRLPRADFRECLLMRSTNTLKLALASTALMLVAGCSKPSDQSEPPRKAEAVSPAGSAKEAAADAASGAAASIPDIGGAAAPGVAFTYSYAFTLPAKAISDVQQKHAMDCERLGPSRCRVP